MVVENSTIIRVSLSCGRALRELALWLLLRIFVFESHKCDDFERVVGGDGMFLLVWDWGGREMPAKSGFVENFHRKPWSGEFREIHFGDPILLIWGGFSGGNQNGQSWYVGKEWVINMISRSRALARGCDRAEISEDKRFSLEGEAFSERGFGKDLCRKGTSLKRSGSFNDSPDPKNLKIAWSIPFPSLTEIGGKKTLYRYLTRSMRDASPKSMLQRGRAGNGERGNGSENFSALSWPSRIINLILKISESLYKSLKTSGTSRAVAPMSVTPPHLPRRTESSALTKTDP